MKINMWHEPNGGDTHLVMTIRRKRAIDKYLACGMAQGSMRGRYIASERLDAINCPQCMEAVEAIWAPSGLFDTAKAIGDRETGRGAGS